MAQQVPISENRRRLGRVVAPFPADSVINATATLAASATATAVTPLTGIQVGMKVTGGGFAAGTTVISVASASSTVVMSAATATTGTLEALTFAFGASVTAKCHLYNVAYSGGPDPTPASFTEETSSWYSALAVGAGSGPYTNPDGSAEIDFGDLAWILFTDPSSPSTEYGYWIDYLDPVSGLTVVAAWENFATPVVMSAIGNAVVISVPINYPLPGSAIAV